MNKFSSPSRANNTIKQNHSTRSRTLGFGHYSEKRLKQLDRIGFKFQAEKLRKDYSNSYRFREIKHRERASSVKELLSKTNTIIQKSGHFLQPTKIISVSGSKWAIFDYFSGKYLRGYRSHDTHQLSVFSKLLVFATVNTLVKKHELDISRFEVIATETPLKMYNSGKRCLLKKDDVVSLEHILCLLLIQPSEEYELIIAINIGAYLMKKRRKQYYSVYDAQDRLFKRHVQQFYDYVNSYCQLMNLENIKYLEYDPDLRKQKNRCSAFDVATLSIECLKMPLFQKIMKSPQATISIKYVDDFGTVSQQQKIIVNKSIQSPFISYYNVCRNWGDNFMNSLCSVYYQEEGIDPIVTVIIGSYSPKDRERDIQQIIEWYLLDWRRKQKYRLRDQQLKESQQKIIEELREGIRKNKRKYQEQQQEIFEELNQIEEPKKNKTVFNSFNPRGSYLKQNSGGKVFRRVKTLHDNIDEEVFLRKKSKREKLVSEMGPQLQTIVEEKLRTQPLKGKQRVSDTMPKIY